ncbi:hypothetical protein ACF0H5_009750 [Mactra antiquata]
MTLTLIFDNFAPKDHNSYESNNKVQCPPNIFIYMSQLVIFFCYPDFKFWQNAALPKGNQLTSLNNVGINKMSRLSDDILTTKTTKVRNKRYLVADTVCKINEK